MIYNKLKEKDRGEHLGKIVTLNFFRDKDIFIRKKTCLQGGICLCTAGCNIETNPYIVKKIKESLSTWSRNFLKDINLIPLFEQILLP